MMHSDLRNRMHSYKLQSLNIQDGGRGMTAILKKSLNGHNSAMVPFFTRFGKIFAISIMSTVKIPNL